MAVVRTQELAGIPLFYDRYSDTSYGESAIPMRPYMDERFLRQTNAAFASMRAAFDGAGLQISEIWSGGVGRSATSFSYHNLNRAFDLDALVFEDRTKWVAITFPERPYLYLAIESILRTQFGTVLNYDYNRAHRDHLHFDNGTPPGFNRMSRSRVIYLQHALNFVFGGTLVVDGVWGPNTSRAANMVLTDLGLGGLSAKENWLAFLETVASGALRMETSVPVS